MLPPLQLRPVSTSHFYTSGDVTIQDGAAIAPGVLMQADPNSRIIIKSGACIGIGSVLHAHQGVLEIGEGANIGAEVLLIGQVTIGANACIGSATTILNSAIEGGRVVPSGSLIGDASRSTDALQATDTATYPASNEMNNGQANGQLTAAAATIPEALAQPETGVGVYGRVYVNQLLFKMFPNSQPNPAPQPDSSSGDPWAD